MTMIRRAVAEDIPAIVDMGIRFYLSRAFRRKGFQMSTRSLDIVLRYLIEKGTGLVVVAEKEGKLAGSMIGMISPWIGDTTQSIMQEVWWWVDAEHQGEFVGKRMFTFYEAQAREMGITFSIVGTHEFDGEDQLCRVYERLGYKHLQHDFIKEL